MIAQVCRTCTVSSRQKLSHHQLTTTMMVYTSIYAVRRGEGKAITAIVCVQKGSYRDMFSLVLTSTVVVQWMKYNEIFCLFDAVTGICPTRTIELLKTLIGICGTNLFCSGFPLTSRSLCYDCTKLLVKKNHFSHILTTLTFKFV